MPFTVSTGVVKSEPVPKTVVKLASLYQVNKGFVIVVLVACNVVVCPKQITLLATTMSAATALLFILT